MEKLEKKFQKISLENSELKTKEKDLLEENQGLHEGLKEIKIAIEEESNYLIYVFS